MPPFGNHLAVYSGRLQFDETLLTAFQRVVQQSSREEAAVIGLYKLGLIRQSVKGIVLDVYGCSFFVGLDCASA